MPPAPLTFDPIEEGRRQWAEAGWTAAAPGVGVVGSVARVQQLFLADLEEALAPFGLRFARYETLMLLYFCRDGKVPLGKLSQRLQVHSATVTNVVSRLEDQGMVRRQVNRKDARSAFAVITARGRRTALAATEAVRQDVLVPFPLTDRESTRLFSLLRKQRVHAGDFATGEEPRVRRPEAAGWSRQQLLFDPIEAACDQWVKSGWADARRGVSIVGSIFRVNQTFMNELDRTLRPLQLSFARFETLMILLFARNQQLPMQKLSDRLQVHPASVTNAIQRLGREGLIRQDANPDDGRSSLASLTEAGYRRVLRAADALQDGVMTDLGLTERECETTFRLLRKIRLAADDLTPTAGVRPDRPVLNGKPPPFNR